MGIQTMGSQGGGQQPQYQTLARQSSLYSLTLDEVQNQLGDLGKPLSSMNLDELLKNVWSAEASQMAMDAENAALASTVLPSASGLQHQGSLTFASGLSKKTVDEVWRDIQQGQRRNNEGRKAHERQPTLGEMTLEDFLVKAGVVSEGSDKNKRVMANPKDLEVPQNICNVGCVDPMSSTHNFSQQPQWLQYQIPTSHHQPQNQQQNLIGAYISSRPSAQTLGVNTGPPLEVGYPENQMAISSPLMGTLSDTQTPGRKRGAPGDIVEKTVERRQKRMIKNRESAARSRARKQAYTNELEIKVSRLEEENERLKRQMDLEKMLHFTPPPEPKHQLRRTSSAPY